MLRGLELASYKQVWGLLLLLLFLQVPGMRKRGQGWPWPLSHKWSQGDKGETSFDLWMRWTWFAGRGNKTALHILATNTCNSFLLCRRLQREREAQQKLAELNAKRMELFTQERELYKRKHVMTKLYRCDMVLVS